MGALIMSFFAAVFCVGALWNDRVIGHFWLLIPIAISAVIMARAYAQLRNFVQPDNPETKRIGRIIMWSSVVEGVGIRLAVNICANIHAPDRTLARDRARCWPSFPSDGVAHSVPALLRPRSRTCRSRTARHVRAERLCGPHWRIWWRRGAVDRIGLGAPPDLNIFRHHAISAA